jgi:hypothetical protein
MITRNLSGGKRRAARRADKLTIICELIIYKIWQLRLLTILWASMASYGESFTSITCGFELYSSSSSQQDIYLNRLIYLKTSGSSDKGLNYTNSGDNRYSYSTNYPSWGSLSCLIVNSTDKPVRPNIRLDNFEPMHRLFVDLYLGIMLAH